MKHHSIFLTWFSHSIELVRDGGYVTGYGKVLNVMNLAHNTQFSISMYEKQTNATKKKNRNGTKRKKWMQIILNKSESLPVLHGLNGMSMNMRWFRLQRQSKKVKKEPGLIFIHTVGYATKLDQFKESRMNKKPCK